MLGVRREGCHGGQPSKLQRAGLIRYARDASRYSIRKKLEARSCECYLVVKDEYDRLLPREMAA